MPYILLAQPTIVVTRTIKIFDGLRYDLLEWKDHVIRVMRNCILIDPNVEPSAAQFIPNAAVSKTVGRSKKGPEICKWI
jgi:hypothetical protein